VSHEPPNLIADIGFDRSLDGDSEADVDRSPLDGRFLGRKQTSPFSGMSGPIRDLGTGAAAIGFLLAAANTPLAVAVEASTDTGEHEEMENLGANAAPLLQRADSRCRR